MKFRTVLLPINTTQSNEVFCKYFVIREVLTPLAGWQPLSYGVADYVVSAPLNELSTLEQDMVQQLGMGYGGLKYVNALLLHTDYELYKYMAELEP